REDFSVKNNVAHATLFSMRTYAQSREELASQEAPTNGAILAFFSGGNEDGAFVVRHEANRTAGRQ
ncbi:MAG: hypothetical protein ABW061_26735, partial [Polyangiaceae bacterium]